MRGISLIVCSLLWLGTLAQHCTKDTAWAAMQPLLGKWTGKVEGEAGTGTVKRVVVPYLDGAFMHMVDQAEFPKQEKNPKGEKHTDETTISLDRTEHVFRFKQFQDCGILNEFKQDSISADQRTLVFTTERIENFMPGWRARLTWRLNGEQWVEVFDVASPNKPWTTYMTITFTRDPT